MKNKISSVACIARRFIFSDYYLLFLTLIAALFVIINKGVLGVVVLSLFLSFVMVLTEDLFPILQGIVIISSFAIKLKYSTPEFLKLWPFALPIAVCFFSHFFIYPPKLRRPSTFPGMFAAAVAVTIGGIGIINPLTYFSPTSLFYMCMLGFGMVIICCYITASFEKKRDYDFEDKFCKMMLCAAAIVTLLLLYEYISRRNELSEKLTVIPFQWRNNGSTILMLTMPFAFYYSRKHFAAYLLGIFLYLEILLAGSRGGLLFGAVELGICCITMIILDRRHRKKEIITVIICLALVTVLGKYFEELIRYTIDRMMNPAENSVRIELYKRGIADFKASPFIGRGIAYMGNRDVHPSAKHALCWYHNSVIQVAASCGCVGIAAFTFLNILRIRTFIRNISFFSIIMFISFAGLEMMSLVNPGIFVPVPYLLTVSVYFIVMEFQNSGGKESIISMRRGENS